MPKTLRNKWDKCLTYEKLMEAHNLSKRSKGHRKEIILFNLKKEEYIMNLLEELKSNTYKPSMYTSFYVYEPKLRKIEKAKYLDRIVNRWLVDNFIKPVYIPKFINNTYACIEGRGMHKACLDMQKMMKHCKKIWGNYYILKMDVKKFFNSINKEILLNILRRNIKDGKGLELIIKILYIQEKEVGIEIGNYSSQMFRKYIFE